MAIVEPIRTQAGERRRLGIRSPVTGESVGEIEVQAAEDVAAAIEAARKAQVDWAALSFKERAQYMHRAQTALIARHEELVEIVVRETGKTPTEALMMEVIASCDSLAYYAKRSGKILKEKRQRMHLLSPMKQLRIHYRPLGVVGIITPWNGPFVLSMNPCVQALMAGNAVLLKPSEVTPFSGGFVGEIFKQAGLPEGLLTVLQGDGETGAALVEAGLDKISFTGSVETGRKVGEACARQLIPCTLELGGKDPMIVCADANLERAANGALFGALMNTGQVCMSTERIYVVDSVADVFIEKVVAKVKALQQGDGPDDDIGAIFWPAQLEKIESHVDAARAAGAKVLAGGRRNPDLPGLFYEPTVITDVNHDMTIMRDETFGPILAIQRVRDEDEAVRLANDSRYGLCGSVWTQDKERGVELAKRIDSGSLSVNDPAMTYGVHEAPFGGMKQSGLGQVNGETGLRGFCYAQPVLIDRFGRDNEASWYPLNRAKYTGMQKVLKMIWGTPIGRWIS